MTTIARLLAEGTRPLCSFEFFPPRDDAGEDHLWAAIDRLEPLRPDFISVTYGANGSSRDRTLALTRRLATDTGHRVMGHLTCASQSVDQLTSVIDGYAAAGIGHILAVRGDMPGGPGVPWVAHPDGLANATALVELIRRRGDFCIGVAAFPDGHPPAHDLALDARLLVDKWSAGASFAITQLFFQPRAYVELVDRVRSLGCPIPIIPGIMPVSQMSQVVSFAQMSGAPLPAAMLRQLEAVAHDPAAVRRVGAAQAADVAQRLLDAGAPGLHFFTQNRSRATLAIWRRLRRD